MREISPDAVCVDVLPEHRLQVTFSNGEIKILDATALLLRKCYAALNGDAYFRQAYIENGCVS